MEIQGVPSTGSFAEVLSFPVLNLIFPRGFEKLLFSRRIEIKPVGFHTAGILLRTVFFLPVLLPRHPECHRSPPLFFSQRADRVLMKPPPNFFPVFHKKITACPVSDSQDSTFTDRQPVFTGIPGYLFKKNRFTAFHSNYNSSFHRSGTKSYYRHSSQETESGRLKESSEYSGPLQV